jgi:hypothetical protein
LVLFDSCSRKTADTSGYSDARLRDAAVNYMSQPKFSCSDFTQQITGTEAQLQMFDMDEMYLYFSINKTDFDSSSTLNKMTVNPANVQFGYQSEGKMVLGAYTLKGTERYFFRFPKDEFRTDSSRTIKIDYGDIQYSVNAAELADFAGNKTVYGGKLDAFQGEYSYISNHGAFVAVKNEPSLKRLCMQITGKETGKEKIAMMLFGFVAQKIKYNTVEAYGGYEILKRPNEVLMSKNSDCSGLTILYASLLEQYDIDYRLVYYKGHIAVGVEGKFPEVNGLNFEFDNKKFYIAELTVKDFVIGVTRLTEDESADMIKYIQKPGKDSQIIKFKSGKPLDME